MSEWVECKHIFSNGTEFELFENQCHECSRYRNGKCRIYMRILQSMFDESRFPYSDLLDHVKYGGKRCKHKTTELVKRNRRNKPIKGQIRIGDTWIDDVPTEAAVPMSVLEDIKAEIKEYCEREVIMGDLVDIDILAIIDKHISGKEKE